MNSQSSAAAYATKPNIVYPGTAARAALVADLAETRINDDPSRLVTSAALTVNTDQAAGATETQVALPVA
jgi:hypothetical protein